MELMTRRLDMGMLVRPAGVLAAGAIILSRFGLASVLVPFALALLAGIAKSGTA